ncbi:hypothetical protein DFJ63DRAFT_230398 [Scheffersomyces coipomensis]|uniref:uncharacterized protein n=1 Tax=Scheffersomyces coipomensis TaxID=1788519 RepID=UPI00315D2C86
MQYNSNLISTTLFEESNVSVFKIPPGELSISKWNLNESNIIWKGNLRLIEQEVIQDDVDLFATLPGSRLHSTDTLTWGNTLQRVKVCDDKFINKGPKKPYESLRAKLELYNPVTIHPSVGNLTTVNREELWAEVWYNPIASSNIDHDNNRDDQFSIANDGQETIQMSKESPKFYKIISQLPSSGYQPIQGTTAYSDSLFNEKGVLLQVALGIKLGDSADATGFSESFNLYKRRFRNVEEQYYYELKLLDLEDKSAQLSLTSHTEDTLFPLDDSKHETNRTGSISSFDKSSDESDDEFGDFVGS